MDKFLQLFVSGVALGGIYALIALGFVVIYKATGTFNFAQGGFVLLGTYLAYQFSNVWEVNFYLSVLISILIMAAVAMLIERTVLRRMMNQPPFTIILVTVGILLFLQQLVPIIWDDPGLRFDNPWLGQVVEVGGITISHASVWTVVYAALVFIAFALFFKFTRTGIGMQAAAFDQEAAAAQGISVARSFQVSWAIAGAVAVIAGVMLVARGGDALTPAIGFVALRAFPAMILGGLDSPGGAVVGGVTIGVAEVLTAGYLEYEWLGANFSAVVPYIVLILVLLVRPSGLFGTREVERV
ncbi:MAG: branched-chain amino acid ABC transporter permease [Acidimicrobiales bacterium]